MEWIEDLEQEITRLSKTSVLESYSSKKCQAMLEPYNVCVNEFDLLLARGKSFRFVHEQSAGKRETSKQNR